MEYATAIRTTYENVYAVCPACGVENIFNRVTDLRTTKPIDFLEVTCLQPDCGASFAINGDHVDPLYATMIHDCYDLLRQKHYAYCLLNLGQAVEVMIVDYFRAELVLKPLCRRASSDPALAQRALTQLGEALKRFTLGRLQTLLLNWHIHSSTPSSLEASIEAISRLADLSRRHVDLDRLHGLPNARLAELLGALYRSTLRDLRNDVVHKHRYRPTKEVVAAALEETRSIVFPLSVSLGLPEWEALCDDWDDENG